MFLVVYFFVSTWVLRLMTSNHQFLQELINIWINAMSIFDHWHKCLCVFSPFSTLIMCLEYFRYFDYWLTCCLSLQGYSNVPPPPPPPQDNLGLPPMSTFRPGTTIPTTSYSTTSPTVNGGGSGGGGQGSQTGDAINKALASVSRNRVTSNNILQEYVRLF